eukprot:14097028-Heterocapsa_arctica.AAC.1
MVRGGRSPNVGRPSTRLRVGHRRGPGQGNLARLPPQRGRGSILRLVSRTKRFPHIGGNLYVSASRRRPVPA